MGIGRRIKEARKAAEMTQEELALALGVTKSAVANYENETSHPKEPIMYKMFDALKVDANFLFQDMIALPDGKNDISLSEYEIIKKYRGLDVHGKRVIDFLLMEEYGRCHEHNIDVNIELDGPHPYRGPDEDLVRAIAEKDTTETLKELEREAKAKEAARDAKKINKGRPAK